VLLSLQISLPHTCISRLWMSADTRGRLLRCLFMCVYRVKQAKEQQRWTDTTCTLYTWSLCFCWTTSNRDFRPVVGEDATMLIRCATSTLLDRRCCFEVNSCQSDPWTAYVATNKQRQLAFSAYCPTFRDLQEREMTRCDQRWLRMRTGMLESNQGRSTASAARFVL